MGEHKRSRPQLPQQKVGLFCVYDAADQNKMIDIVSVALDGSKGVSKQLGDLSVEHIQAALITIEALKAHPDPKKHVILKNNRLQVVGGNGK